MVPRQSLGELIPNRQKVRHRFDSPPNTLGREVGNAVKFELHLERFSVYRIGQEPRTTGEAACYRGHCQNFGN